MTDIVDRLHAAAGDFINDLYSEAAVEIERLQSLLENYKMTVAELLANDDRLRAALEAIKTLKPLEPIGDYGDPYAEMTVSAVAIAVNALAGRALEPTPPVATTELTNKNGKPETEQR